MIIIFAAWEGARRTEASHEYDHIVPVLALGALSIAIVDAAMDLSAFVFVKLTNSECRGVVPSRCQRSNRRIFVLAPPTTTLR